MPVFNLLLQNHWAIGTKFDMNVHWMVLYKVHVFSSPDPNGFFEVLPSVGVWRCHRTSLFVNIYILMLFSETTGPIRTILGRIVHWVVLKNIMFFSWLEVRKRNKRPKDIFISVKLSPLLCFQNSKVWISALELYS